MLRLTLALPLLLTLALPQAPTQTTPAIELAPTPGCCNTFLHEPLLAYDVAGSTLVGPTYLHLVVYDDGHALIAATTDTQDPGRAAVALLSRVEVQALRAALVARGAFTQCDDTAQTADLPLRTVTVLGGTTNALAHTFSYTAPNASQAAIEQRIQSLIALHFPGF